MHLNRHPTGGSSTTDSVTAALLIPRANAFFKVGWDESSSPNRTFGKSLVGLEDSAHPSMKVCGTSRGKVVFDSVFVDPRLLSERSGGAGSPSGWFRAVDSTAPSTIEPKRPRVGTSASNRHEITNNGGE